MLYTSCPVITAIKHSCSYILSSCHFLKSYTLSSLTKEDEYTEFFKPPMHIQMLKIFPAVTEMKGLSP
jgi:hypothetical protein